MIRVEVKLLEQEMMLYIMDKTTKNLAWNTFKQTGNIDTFMELIQVENIEKNMAKNIEEMQYGNNKNEGDNPFRK